MREKHIRRSGCYCCCSSKSSALPMASSMSGCLSGRLSLWLAGGCVCLLAQFECAGAYIIPVDRTILLSAQSQHNSRSRSSSSTARALHHAEGVEEKWREVEQGVLPALVAARIGSPSRLLSRICARFMPC